MNDAGTCGSFLIQTPICLQAELHVSCVLMLWSAFVAYNSCLTLWCWNLHVLYSDFYWKWTPLIVSPPKIDMCNICKVNFNHGGFFFACSICQRWLSPYPHLVREILPEPQHRWDCFSVETAHLGQTNHLATVWKQTRLFRWDCFAPVFAGFAERYHR